MEPTNKTTNTQEEKIGEVHPKIQNIKPLVISAPFGNYIKTGNSTSTLGTFTLARRPGRLIQIIRTVRYYPRIKAWVNKLGLRNPGIMSVEKKNYEFIDKIISIHGFQTNEWEALFSIVKVWPFLAIELNVSCPNVPHDVTTKIWKEVFQKARQTLIYSPIIVKLSPVNYKEIMQVAIDEGIMHFHCFNTLPTPGGGLSGKPLIPGNCERIREIRQKYPNIFIIGGGGISQKEDVRDYIRAGADRVAMASALFFPWKIRKIAELADCVTYWQEEKEKERIRVLEEDQK